MEIVDVVSLFPPEASLTNDQQSDYMEMLRLLDSVQVEKTSVEPDSRDVSVRRGLEAGREDLVYKTVFQEEYLVLLNRQERKRLELHDGQIYVMDVEGRQDGKEVSGTLDSDDRPSKRLRLDLDVKCDSHDLVHITQMESRLGTKQAGHRSRLRPEWTWSLTNLIPRYSRFKAPRLFTLILLLVMKILQPGYHDHFLLDLLC